MPFDENIRFEDPHPGGRWCPSPAQILAWGQIIQQENAARDEARRMQAEAVRKAQAQRMELERRERRLSRLKNLGGGGQPS